MNPIVVVALAVIYFVGPGSCGWCDKYENQLRQIDHSLSQIAANNNIRLYAENQSYSSRAKYVLEKLDAKCKPLEDEINRMSHAFSIEKEGLEDYPTRLQKLFNYLNDREVHQLQEVERQKTLQGLCAEKNHDLNDAVRAMNKTINEHAAKIRSQEVLITKLQEEKRKLAAKVNKNAAAIDGQTGSITGTELEAEVSKNATTIDGQSGSSTGTEVPKMGIDVRASDSGTDDAALANEHNGDRKDAITAKGGSRRAR